MTNFLLKIFTGTTEQYKNSDVMDPNFLSVAINGLPIVNTSGNIDFGAVRLVNLADPVGSHDALTFGLAGETYLALAGGTMSGAINMGSQQINDLAAGTASTDAVNLGQVMLLSGANAMAGNLAMGSNKITGLANGTNAADAVNFSQLSAVAGGAVTLPENQILVGNASNISTAVAMSGEASIVASGAVTLSNAAVIAKVLTGYVSGAGTISATDSILTAIQKVDGNDQLKLALAGGTMSGAIAMGGHKITGLGAPSANGDALRWDMLAAANGIATLDGGGKIPLGQLPSSVFLYQGSWNPNTNTPALADGTGVQGYVYWVSAAFAGTVSGLNDASMTNFNIGDLVIYNGSVWELTTPAAGVMSVNSLTGAVVINAINQLTGDVVASAASGSQSKATSLVATSNATLVTLSALTTASALASIGTITTGVWNAQVIGSAYGGTGGSSASATGIAHLSSGVWTYSAIVNADVSASAAIAYSKLNLSASIVNADISGSAAIAYSKLNLSDSIQNSDLTTGVFDQSTISGGNGVAASVIYYQPFVNDNAGTITAGQVVYIKSNGHVDLANATNAALPGAVLGVVKDASITTGSTGNIYVGRGVIIGGFTGLTPGALQYVSNATAGALVSSVSGYASGSSAYSIGRAMSATQIVYDPQFQFQFA